MSDPEIVVARHAPLVALGIAAGLRRAAADPRLAAAMRKLGGRIAIRSATDAQAATVRFARGRIEVEGGVASDVQVIVTADFARMGFPDAPKPKVTGALRHPLFALRAAKVLDPKVPGGWRGAVEDFCRRAEGRLGLPDPLLVVCTEDGTELRTGNGSPPQLEIHGSGEILASVFTSALHPGEAWFEGHVRLLADHPSLERFMNLCQRLMIGR